MMPLLDRTGPNPSELFQIWLNLPAAQKMVDPYFTMLWRRAPRAGGQGRRRAHCRVSVVAGAFGGACRCRHLPIPGHRSRESEVAIWQARFEPGGAVDPSGHRPLRDGADACTSSPEPSASASTTLPAPVGAVLRTDSPLEVTAGSEGAEVLILQGRPIGEPVAQYGPFVMNDRAGIEQAFRDYRRTGFGGWPWPTDDPVHPADSGRFAVHPDGHSEHPDE